MKKNTLYILLSILLVSLFNQKLAAQPLAPQDCYKTYRSQGDTYKAKGNYELAVQQYKNAKYCSKLTPAQIKELDTLIEETNRMTIKRKIMVKRF